jgi:hypothetical protein
MLQRKATASLICRPEDLAALPFRFAGASVIFLQGLLLLKEYMQQPDRETTERTFWSPHTNLSLLPAIEDHKKKK